LFLVVEDTEPFEGRAEVMVHELGEHAPEVQRIRSQEKIRTQMVSIKKELVDQRIVYRYGLCFWALRLLRTVDAKDESALAFEHFASHFREVSQVVQAASLAFAAEWEDRVPWSDWILLEYPEGEAHFIDVDSEILRTFVTLLLLSPDLEEQARAIGPLEWLPARLQQAEDLLDEVVRDDTLQRYVAHVRFRERSGIVRELLRQSERAQRKFEEQKVRDSDLMPEKVEDFKANLRKAWKENRLTVVLFQRYDSYEEVPDEPTASSEGRWFTLDEWLPKSLFVPEPQVYGVESIAQQMGFQLANGEMRELVTKLSDSPIEERASGTVRKKIQAAIASMTEAGFQPSVIFAPVGFGLRNINELDHAADGLGVWSLLPRETPQPIVKRFSGRIESVPVFDTLHVPEDRACIVDLAAFATWRQWKVNAGQLSVKIEDFDAEEALQVAREYPQIFRTAERRSAEDRAAEARRHVYLKVREYIDLVVKKQEAARWVHFTGPAL
jgi:hypothetical protein